MLSCHFRNYVIFTTWSDSKLNIMFVMRSCTQDWYERYEWDVQLFTNMERGVWSKCREGDLKKSVLPICKFHDITIKHFCFCNHFQFCFCNHFHCSLTRTWQMKDIVKVHTLNAWYFPEFVSQILVNALQFLGLVWAVLLPHLPQPCSIWFIPLIVSLYVLSQSCCKFMC